MFFLNVVRSEDFDSINAFLAACKAVICFATISLEVVLSKPGGLSSNMLGTFGFLPKTS